MKPPDSQSWDFKWNTKYQNVP